MKLLVLINPGGGSAGEDALKRVATALSTAGIDADIEQVEGPDLDTRAIELANRGAETIVAAGGDGTMSAIGGALAGTRTALGILPLGTLNHFARDLGISFDLDEAAATLAAGHRRQIDVAELNGRVFVNNSAIGLYPLMVADRDSQQERLGRSKRLAMLVASVRTLGNYHEQRLRLSVDGSTETLDTPMLFVGNNDYRIALPAAGKRDSLDAGHLGVLVMRKKGLPGFLAATLRALVGLSRNDDMVSLEGVERLRVNAGRPRLTVAIDGETCSFATPLDYHIRKRALNVIAPPPGKPE